LFGVVREISESDCNFGFAKGWRCAITRTIMRRKLDAVLVESLSRLKRAAESDEPT
jgi:hypothetical protein